MDAINKKEKTGCCKRFDPKPWDDKEINWKDKIFLKDHVRTLFHIPIGFDKVMLKNMKKIENARALNDVGLMLYDDTSLFGADIYIAVKKDVPESEMSKISGKFLSKVFEGPFKDSGKWLKEMKEYVKSKNKETEKIYFFYTTCPACAKYYGKNYVVLLAKI